MEKEYSCPCLHKCPLQQAMDVIGGKWKIEILCSLHTNGSTRYNELKRKLTGISNTMLTKSLKELEADGLISREEYVEVPIRIEYKITEKAKNLIPILKDLAKWGLTLCNDHDN